MKLRNDSKNIPFVLKSYYSKLKFFYLGYRISTKSLFYVGKGEYERVNHLFNEVSTGSSAELINSIAFEDKLVFRIAVGPEDFITGLEDYCIQTLRLTEDVYNKNRSILDRSLVNKYNLYYEEILKYIKDKEFLNLDCIKPKEKRLKFNIINLPGMSPGFILNMKKTYHAREDKYSNMQWAKGKQIIETLKQNPSNLKETMALFNVYDLSLLERYFLKYCKEEDILFKSFKLLKKDFNNV